jgi:hypothetical protein
MLLNVFALEAAYGNVITLGQTEIDSIKQMITLSNLLLIQFT